MSPEPVPAYVTLPLAGIGLTLTLVAAGLLGLGPGRQLLLFAAVAGACALGATLRAAAGVGVLAWALHDGFAVHSYGDLSFAYPADVRRLGLCLAVPVLVAGAGTAWRRHAARRAAPARKAGPKGRFRSRWYGRLSPSW